MIFLITKHHYDVPSRCPIQYADLLLSLGTHRCFDRGKPPNTASLLQFRDRHSDVFINEQSVFVNYNENDNFANIRKGIELILVRILMKSKSAHDNYNCASYL